MPVIKLLWCLEISDHIGDITLFSEARKCHLSAFPGIFLVWPKPANVTSSQTRPDPAIAFEYL